MKLRARVAKGLSWVGLRLEGIIDEQSRLDIIVDRLRPYAAQATLVIDMGGVTRLNSVGVRDWVLALREMRQLFPAVQLMDCTPPVMNEVNFVRNFSEGTVIASFQAPLFCTRCSKESFSTMDVYHPEDGSQIKSLPVFSCERTDCENALDDDESSFLTFLDGQPPAPDPQHVRRLMTEVRAAFQGKQDQHLDLGAGASSHSPPTEAELSPAQTQTHAPTRLMRESTTRKTDIVFSLAVTAMMIVLGVLIFLIATLE